MRTTLEYDEFNGHKKARKPRPFTIEYRALPNSWAWRLSKDNEWRVCGRYETERGREEALENSQHKSRQHGLFEYRRGGP